MTKNFKIFKWDLTISIGFSYWGGEPEPLKASWGFEIDLDFNNGHKLKKNYDLTKILDPDIHGGKWVAMNELNTAVVDYDSDLMALSKRVKEKGVTVVYTRYGNEGMHL